MATPEGAYEVWYRDLGSSDVLLDRVASYVDTGVLTPFLPPQS